MGERTASRAWIIFALFAFESIAAASEPAATASELGIMQGSPVPQEHRVTLGNWMVAPFNRWSLQHMPQILPTANISRGDGPVARLPVRLENIGDLRFESAPSEMLSISQWLAVSYTDGFIVVQDGEILFESYLNGMEEHTRHLSYSISKSVIGILAGILVDEDKLDLTRKVEDYIPELRPSGFAGYRVRDLLDMQAAIKWSEDYTNPNGSWRRWKDAIGWTPAADEFGAAPAGNYNFLPGLQRDKEWPGGFKYVSPSTEVVGWVLERASGQPLADLLSQKLWAPLGVQHDAYITTDHTNASAAAGGFGATLRDLARFGQMVLNDGHFNNRQIVSAKWIADIRFNGSNAAWRSGQYRGYWNPKGAYRSLWYVSGDDDGSFEAIGIHGQRLYINPAQKLVVVRLSSHPEAAGREGYVLGTKAIAAIRAALQENVRQVTAEQ